MKGYNFQSTSPCETRGELVATIATPLDPSDDDWSRAAAIVCEIIGKKVGGGRLRSRELPCAVANSAPMSAAELALVDSSGGALLSV